MDRVLNWGTTPGMGDSMMGLNCAYRWSAENKRDLTLNLHWFHGKDHLHHFEEEETIIERTNYIKNLYLKSNVKINHIINSKEYRYANAEGRFDWFNPRNGRDTNNWMFDPSTFLKSQEDKVVLWRPTFNAEVPRVWKRIITNSQWDFIIYNLKSMGYNVVELTYRSPIREATYHINTCNFIVCYDGMWHYIARNFFKPMIISSHDNITRYHTRHALPYAENKFVDYVTNIHTKMEIKNKKMSPYEFMHRRANKHKEIFLEWYYGNR